MARHSLVVISAALAALATACSGGSKALTSQPTLTSVLPATTCTSAAVLALGSTDTRSACRAGRSHGGTQGACIYLAGGVAATAPLTLTPTTEYFLW